MKPTRQERAQIAQMLDQINGLWEAAVSTAGHPISQIATAVATIEDLSKFNSPEAILQGNNLIEILRRWNAATDLERRCVLERGADIDLRSA